MASFDRPAFTEFLTGLYDDAVDDQHRLVLWTGRDKRSRWLTDIEGAGEVLESISPGTDLYYGVCLQDHEAALAERRERNRDEKATLD
ncbi:MAG: hypothetical protein VW713_07210, partial [Alphaproteobacteria bacterium]